METTNSDRKVAILFIFILIIAAIAGIAYAGGFWKTTLFMLWIIISAIWGISGKKMIEVGWKGQLLLFGQRQTVFFGEGLHWAPWPWAIKPVDCRTKTTKLDPIKVFTSDGLEVTIKDMSIVWKVFNLDLYHNMDMEKFTTLLDDVVDRNVREKIRTSTLEKILGKNIGTENVQTAQDLEDFGINIIKIVVPEIIPTNPEVLRGLELNQTENFEKIGQITEAKHINELITFFMTPTLERPNGLTQSEAIELTQLITGKAAPKNINGFTLNQETLAAVSNIMGGRKWQ